MASASVDRACAARQRRGSDRRRIAGVRDRRWRRERRGRQDEARGLLPVFTADPARPLAVAARARRLGVDGVFAPDHLFPPVFYPPSGPDRPAREAFSLLAAVAAQEPEMHVGTLVARVTLRAPGILAKQAAALDAMTGGRAILALGTGDRASVEEHDRFGIPFPGSPSASRSSRRPWRRRARSSPGTHVGRGEHVPPLAGPLLPPGEPSIWVGGLSEAVRRGCPGRGRVERMGPRRGRVRGSLGPLARAGGRAPGRPDLGGHRARRGGPRIARPVARRACDSRTLARGRVGRHHRRPPTLRGCVTRHRHGLVRGAPRRSRRPTRRDRGRADGDERHATEAGEAGRAAPGAGGARRGPGRWSVRAWAPS